MPPHPRRRAAVLPAAVLIVLLLTALTTASASAAGVAGLNKRVCVRALHLDEAQAFNAIIGRDVNCVLTYNDVAPDWTAWEKPWLVVHSDPNQNWAKWAAAQPGRQLIISQSLFPKTENGTDWRHAGARGDYDEHARALARNLVAAGQGNAVIRLAHEANGDWYADNIGTSQADYDLWIKLWRREVQAMKSVPGAQFTFDWCVNAAYRAIPLASYYPGDDVVDVVGIDAYDSGIPNVSDGATRWNTVLNRRGGVAEVLNFAKARNKPLSIPEWGVAPTWQSYSGGDDSEYVDGIAKVVRENNVAYQSYFYAYAWRSQLETGPRSLAAYRRHFGAAGDSVTPTTTTTTTTTATPAPATTTTTSGSTTTATAPATPTATVVLLPVAPIAPVSIATAPATLRAQSTATAGALAKAALTQIRAASRTRSRARRRTATVSITPALEGTACVTALPAAEHRTRVRCGASELVVGPGAGPAIARAARSAGAAGAAVKMAHVRATRAVRGVLRITVPARRKGSRLTIVSAFVAAGDPSVVGVASRDVRIGR